MTHQNNEPYGVQQLRECSMVTVNREVQCCSSSYSVSSGQGVLFNSEGNTHMIMKNARQQLVMSFRNKQPWFDSAYTVVQMANCQPVTLSIKGGFSSSLLIIDELDQPRLKIRRPSFMSRTYKVLGANDIEIGKLKCDWSDWDVRFPQDLEVRFKAALIAACVYYDIEEARRRRRN